MDLSRKFVISFSVCTVESFSKSLSFNSKEPTKCLYLNNQQCQTGSLLGNTNSDESPFYQFTVNVNKREGCCNTIDDSYVRFSVPNKFKNMIAKVFNLKSGVNETRSLVQHESCKCKCGLNKAKIES